jgi:alpha-amylase
MVILQGFHWNCLNEWYKVLEVLADTLEEKQFDQIWLPPPSKGMAGDSSMGYDIKEHYNLDSKFGDKRELKKLINKLHDNNIEVIADLVLGHMLGGEKQFNPLLNKETYTKFDNDDFPMNYNHFCHECGKCNADNEFGETICYYSDNNYMRDNLIEWSNWLVEDIGFDNFRLDNVKDIRWDFIEEFSDEFDGRFIVGEYWDGDDEILKDLIGRTDIHLFNFPLFYKLREMCMNPMYSMKEIEDISTHNKVNFVSNHDIDRRERDSNKDAIVNNKELAYAYILFQEQPAVVFWNDYFEYKLKKDIDKMIEVRKLVEDDPLEVLYLDDDLYVAKRGNYNLYINNSNNERYYDKINIRPQSYKLI